jgi:hypothetical protein
VTVAKYKVQGPDGSIHVFEGPDGASQEQVVAFAQQHFGKPSQEPAQMKREIEDPGVMGTLGIGAGRTVDQIPDAMATSGPGRAVSAGRAEEEQRREDRSLPPTDRNAADFVGCW